MAGETGARKGLDPLRGQGKECLGMEMKELNEEKRRVRKIPFTTGDNLILGTYIQTCNMLGTYRFNILTKLHGYRPLALSYKVFMIA